MRWVTKNYSDQTIEYAIPEGGEKPLRKDYRARLFVEGVELDARDYDGPYSRAQNEVYDTMVVEALDAGFDVVDIHVELGGTRMVFA